MRIVFFALGGFLAVLGIIICFQNMVINSSGMMIFFEAMSGTLFWPLLYVLCIGFLSGLFFGMGIFSDKKSSNTDFQDDFDI